jgi:hypothetical protein
MERLKTGEVPAFKWKHDSWAESNLNGFVHPSRSAFVTGRSAIC